LQRLWQPTQRRLRTEPEADELSSEESSTSATDESQEDMDNEESETSEEELAEMTNSMDTGTCVCNVFGHPL
jgi:hypothetical protein